MDRTRTADPVREQLEQLIAAWEAGIGTRPMTVGDVLLEAEHDADLRRALEMVASGRNGPDGRRLGSFLRRMKDRRCGGRRLTDDGRRKGQTVWVLQ